jgi:hypothetical protein
LQNIKLKVGCFTRILITFKNWRDYRILASSGIERGDLARLLRGTGGLKTFHTSVVEPPWKVISIWDAMMADQGYFTSPQAVQSDRNMGLLLEHVRQMRSRANMLATLWK